MTTSTFASVFTNNSDTNFRAWGSGLSNALAAVGLVKTADTGQINWSTVTAPGAINTQQGYEVWRFNDGLQSTAPIFVRIGYGAYSPVATPGLWITLGKGSDGAGTITGVLQAAIQSSTGSSSASTWTSYVASGDGSALVFSLAPGGTSNNSLWILERSRTSAGVATGDGVTFIVNNTNGIGFNTYGYSYAAGAVSSRAGYGAGLPQSTTVDTSLAISGAAPVYAGTVYVSGFLWQSRAIVVGMRTDVGSLATLTVPGFGSYFSLGAAGQKADAAGGTYATACVVWS